MGEKILKHPVIYALINLALCMLIIIAVGKFYIDYKVDRKTEQLEQQLDRIESSQDTILEILKER